MAVSWKSASIATLVILLFWASPSKGAEACNKPRLVSDQKKSIWLFLPESVQETIRSTFAGLAVPGASDMKGLWATETKPGSLPYFAEGDFNGDGRQDFAVVLSNEKEFWLVIFHGQAECSFTVGHKIGGYTGIPLQSVFLRTIPKGQEEVITGSETSRYKFETDALEMTIVDRGIAVYYWKNGRYEFYDFSDE
jgi:hypothetical protein